MEGTLELTLKQLSNPTVANIAIIAGVAFAFCASRYLLLAGGHYVLFYRIFSRFGAAHKLDPIQPSTKSILHEVKFGLLNIVNFMFFGVVMWFMYWNGLTLIYTDITQYAFWYLPVSLAVLMFFNDAYFYWIHRLLHTKYFLKFHRPHHVSHNPTPFAAFSVHPVEGFMEVAFRPLIISVLPLHPYVIAMFLLVSMSLNVYGHGGIEIFPKKWTQFLFFKYSSSPTHHFLHHKNGNYNFGLYLRVWDLWCKTENPEYKDRMKTPMFQNWSFRLLNLWPPVRIMGFKFFEKEESLDFTIKQNIFNSNYFGSIFGGCLFSSADFTVPFVQKKMGSDCFVIDHKTEIVFCRPAKGTIRGQVKLSAEQASEFKNTLSEKNQIFPELLIDLKNDKGRRVARIKKTLFIAKTKVLGADSLSTENNVVDIKSLIFS
jgi:Delta7-sterol 5-desaturase